VGRAKRAWVVSGQGKKEESDIFELLCVPSSNKVKHTVISSSWPMDDVK